MIKITETGKIPTRRLESAAILAAAQYRSLSSFNKGFRLAGRSTFGKAFNESMNHRFPDVRYHSAHICKY